MDKSRIGPATIQVSPPDPDGEFIRYSQKKSEEIYRILQPSFKRFIISVFFCSLTFWLVIPIVVLTVMYYYNKSTKYIITNERIRVIRGLFVKHIYDLELYRVKDISITVPFLLNMFKLATIELYTSDPSNPIISLEAIPNAQELEENIRYFVDKRRDEKKVQEIDQYQYRGT